MNLSKVLTKGGVWFEYIGNPAHIIEQDTVQSWLFGKIGQNAYVSNFDDKKEFFDVSIGISFPRIIKDEKSKEEFLKFIQFDDLHNFQINKRKGSEELIKIPRIEIYQKAYTKLFELNMKTEDIVLEATYSKLTHIPFIRSALSPIYSILYEAYVNSSINVGDFKPRQRRYFNLLETLDLIRHKSGNTYQQGNMFIKIEEEVRKEKEKEVIDYVFGYAIKRGKKYLIDNVKINTLIPFIRIANTYYFQTLEVGKIINTKLKELQQEYVHMYPQLRITKTPKFHGLLNQIVDAEIIKQEDEYYFGYPDIFKNIKDMAHNRLIIPTVIV